MKALKEEWERFVDEVDLRFQQGRPLNASDVKVVNLLAAIGTPDDVSLQDTRLSYHYQKAAGSQNHDDILMLDVDNTYFRYTLDRARETLDGLNGTIKSVGRFLVIDGGRP